MQTCPWKKIRILTMNSHVSFNKIKFSSAQIEENVSRTLTELDHVIIKISHLKIKSSSCRMQINQVQLGVEV